MTYSRRRKTKKKSIESHAGFTGFGKISPSNSTIAKGHCKKWQSSKAKTTAIQRQTGLSNISQRDLNDAKDLRDKNKTF